MHYARYDRDGHVCFLARSPSVNSDFIASTRPNPGLSVQYSGYFSLFHQNDWKITHSTSRPYGLTPPAGTPLLNCDEDQTQMLAVGPVRALLAIGKAHI